MSLNMPGSTLLIPAGWFDFFLHVLFFIHLILINIVIGWSIISLVEEVKNKDIIPKFTSSRLPTLLAFAINLGVAALLFLQVLWSKFFYTSSVLIAPFWLSIVFVLILAYYLLYLYDFKFYSLSSAVRMYIMALVVLSFLYIAFIFVSNMSLMLRPGHWQSIYFKEKLFFSGEPSLLPRYFHFIVASVAIGGLVFAFWGSKKGNLQVKVGLKWFIGATFLQVIIGVWFLLSLPKEVILSIMRDKLSLVYLSTAIFFLLFSLFLAFKQKLMQLIYSVFFLVLSMVLLRSKVRFFYLKDKIAGNNFILQNDYSSFVLFLITLVLVTGLLGYIFKVYTESKLEE